VQVSSAGDVHVTAALGTAVLGPVVVTGDIHITKNSSALVVATAATAQADIHLDVPVAVDPATTLATLTPDASLRVLRYYDDVVAAVSVSGVSAEYELDNSTYAAAYGSYSAAPVVASIIYSAVVSDVIASVSVERGVTATTEVEYAETYIISYLKAA
jgi:hypothetical protein